MSAGRIVNVQCEDLKEHPQASIVPDMQPDEYAAFKEDVRINGVQEPILVCKTTVIDGRQRLRVQKELHVDTIPVRYEELTPKEQLDRLIRTALLRRHLNESQRAMLAARLKPAISKAASASEKSTSAAAIAARPEDSAGKALNVSGDSVARAEKVIAKGSAALQEAVSSGEVSVSAAALVAELPKAEQTKAVKNGTVAAVAKEVKEAKKPKPESAKKEKAAPTVSEMFTDLMEHFRLSALLIDKIHNATNKKHGTLHESAMNSLDIANQDAAKWRKLCK